jgi:carbon-monoxide dehydrogenase medium subunit
MVHHRDRWQRGVHVVIPPPFDYYRPNTADEALALLSDIPGSVLLAGGQTLINALKLDLVAPTALIDIHRVNDLRGILDGPSTVSVGAAVTYTELAASEAATRVPALAQACASLVDRQVRNRGTVGGNVCLNDPTSNLPPLLAVLGATFVVLTQTGAKTLQADEFFQGTMLTAAAGGVLVSVTVPVTPPTMRVFYRHQQVGADSWAVARVVGAVTLKERALSDVHLYLAAVPGSPIRLTEVESVLEGASAMRPEVRESAIAAFDMATTEFVGDAHGSADYRRHLAREQLKRLLNDIATEEATA